MIITPNCPDLFKLHIENNNDITFRAGVLHKDPLNRQYIKLNTNIDVFN